MTDTMSAHEYTKQQMREAIDRFREAQPQFVILDINMPVLDGVAGTTGRVEVAADAVSAPGVPLVVDGVAPAPGVPCASDVGVPVDVAALDVDFYVFSAHKLYGPTGIGALYGRAELLRHMPPWQGGGDMIRTVAFDNTTFAPPPQRFEAGTPNIAGAIALAAAIDYVQGVGLARIHVHEQALLDYGTRALAAIPGVRLVGTAERKAGILSFLVDGIHPHDLGTILDAEGVAIRAGHHCAMPLMTRFGIPGTARASLGLYNGLADLDALVAAIHKAQELFGTRRGAASGNGRVA